MKLLLINNRGNDNNNNGGPFNEYICNIMMKLVLIIPMVMFVMNFVVLIMIFGCDGNGIG